MKNINLFSNNYINLLFPYYIEYLHDIIGVVKSNKEKINFKEIKEETINIIKKMLEYDILFVIDFDNLKSGKKIPISNYSIPDIIKDIDEKWTKDTQFPDFYSIVFFGYNRWYVDGLEKIATNHSIIWKHDILRYASTNNRIYWRTFVEKKIGDLKEWIETNKP